MTSTEDLTPETHSGATRRTVLKTVGHAAWMIPAVQIASQVPAMAAASTDQLSATNGSHSAGGKAGKDLIISGVSVKNESPTTATQINASVSFQGGGTVNGATVSGWSRSGSGTSSPVSFTSNATVAPGGSLAFAPTITLQNQVSGVTNIQINFSATNFTGASVTA